MAGRVLVTLAEEYDLVISRVDVSRHPLRAIKAGITMIPTVMAGDKKISGILLTEARLRDFFAPCSQSKKDA